MVSLSKKTLLALLPFYLAEIASSQASGTGSTTRYWDCCKPSCAWPGKATLASGSNPVAMCDIHDNYITDYNAVSGCESGGTAFMPSSESPWAVSDDLSYGYAAVNIAGGSEASWCCACYELTFTSGAVAGKKMIVQATNTGGDLGTNQFDLSIPGGGVGIYNGCTAEWGAPSSGWGAQYGGISSRADCDSFPDALKDGCYWRFDWFMGADNPSVSFTQVTCPAALTAKTGCVREGETPTGPSVLATVDAAGVSSTAVASSVAASSTAVAGESSSAAVVTTTEAAAQSTSAAVETSASSSPAGVFIESSSTSQASPAVVDSTTAGVATSFAAGVSSTLAIYGTSSYDSTTSSTSTTTTTTTVTSTFYTYPISSSSEPSVAPVIPTTAPIAAVSSSESTLPTPPFANSTEPIVTVDVTSTVLSESTSAPESAVTLLITDACPVPTTTALPIPVTTVTVYTEC